MKTVKFVALFFSEGTSNKEYRVEIVMVSAQKYLVNVKYGRKAANLKTDTKTLKPVSQDEALEIFDKVVTSKVAKGYEVEETLSFDHLGTKESFIKATPKRKKEIISQSLGLDASSKAKAPKKLKPPTKQEHIDLFNKVDSEGFGYYMLQYGPDLKLIERMGFNLSEVQAAIDIFNRIDDKIMEAQEFMSDEDEG